MTETASYPAPPRRRASAVVITVLACVLALAVVVAVVLQAIASSHAEQQLRNQGSQLRSQNAGLQRQLAAVQRQLADQQSQLTAAKAASKGATLARLGICWSADTSNSGDVFYVSSVSIDSPLVSGGVYSCPQGETYTAITPQAPGSRAGG